MLFRGGYAVHAGVQFGAPDSRSRGGGAGDNHQQQLNNPHRTILHSRHHRSGFVVDDDFIPVCLQVPYF